MKDEDIACAAGGVDDTDYSTKVRAEAEKKDNLRVVVIKKVEKAIKDDEAHIASDWLDIYYKLP